ncbi:MAG TPA: hypothetical protein PKU80_03060 [Candidatus Limiplasma sp.]|nr:hypothetical protein [Candidatus Limiplasma sp.]
MIAAWLSKEAPYRLKNAFHTHSGGMEDEALLEEVCRTQISCILDNELLIKEKPS